MLTSTQGNTSRTDSHLADFPALAQLRITAADLLGLASQGTVCQEIRHEATYFKLRFRRGRRQIVRYIGDAERASAVRIELERLQSETKCMRNLKRLAKIASRLLRESKQQLKPILEAHGLAFHGLAIRRPRQ